MRITVRRHLTYANVAATVALVFSMSAGALAASHYIITSTSQIKPSVRRSLIANPQQEVRQLVEAIEDQTKLRETTEARITKLCESIHEASRYVPNKLTSETLFDIWDKGC